MVDFYTVGPGGEVEKNGKLIVDKLVAARNEDKLHKFSESQLNKIEEKVVKENRITVARKALNKLAGSYPSGDVDDEGNDLSIDDKIKQVKKGDEFPYNIPIIGWICQQIELAILRSKKNSIKEQILNEIENGTISENNKNALGQNNFKALGENDIKNKIRNEIKEEKAKDEEFLKKYGQIAAMAINSAEAGLNSEQKDQIVGKFAKNNVNLSTDKILTEDQWKKLEQLVERHKKEVQAKSTNVGREQEQLVVKPNPAAIAANKGNVQQTQAVAQVPKAKAEQVKVQQTVPTGMQITGTSVVKAGTVIGSCATSVGTGQSKSKVNALG